MSNIRCINFYDLCRICTASNGNDQNTNIFSPEGRAKNLSYKIAECLSLHIDDKDRLPKVICTQCVQHVEELFEFRNVCKNSQTMLNNCLNYRTLQTDDKVFIKDATNDSGKSLSVLSNANTQLPNVLAGNGLTIQSATGQPNDLLSSIMQAVSVQVQQQQQPQQYTITMDNSLQQLQTSQPQAELQLKQEKHNTLEEFIRMKPDIKITPLSKKDNLGSGALAAHTSPVQKQQPQQQSQLQTTQLQIQPQQLNDHLQQQALWQQLQQLTNQLQAQAQFQPSNSASTDDGISPSDSKKPKLNFMLSSPAAPQFATSLPQFGGQPQIQLQLLPSGLGATGVSGQPQQFNAAALLSSLAGPQVSAAANALATNPATNMLSPNKCFLPITIRDENSDQQIVAHIDTKNLVLPTTYQVQMKLQPQLATADGRPIMQLTPTSIPATLQLTPQTLGNTTTFQSGTTTSTTTNTLPNQFLTTQPQPQQTQQQQQTLQPQHTQQQQQSLPATVQVTSQQIIRSPHAHANNSPVVIRNVASEPSTPHNNAEAASFKTPSTPRKIPQQHQQQRQQQQQQQQQQPQQQRAQQQQQQPLQQQQRQQQPRQQQTQQQQQTHPAHTKNSSSNAATANVINITPTTEFTKRLVEQVKQQQLQHQAKQQQQVVAPIVPTTPLSSRGNNNVTVQRLSTNTTITKVAKQQPVATTNKLPLINKQNITISRIPTPVPVPSQVKQVNQVAKPMSRSSQQQQQPQQTPVKQQEAATKTTATTINAGTAKPSTVSSGSSNANISSGMKKLRKLPESSPPKPRPQQQILPIPAASSSEGQLQQSNSETAATSTAVLTCPTCGREFKKKEHLTQHVKLHQGLRPFKCTEEGCDKAFSRKEHLSRHLVSHSGQKMFTCEVCKKPFSRKDNLNKHKRIHSTQPNETLHSCDICNKNFASKTHYDNHREMHEKSQNSSTTPATASANNVASKLNQYEIKQAPASVQPQIQMLQNVSQHQQQQRQQQQQQQPQIMHVQLQPTVVTTQDLAGNTITITQATDSNLQTSLANFVQLGFPHFQNAGATNQIVCKIEK